MSPSVNSCVWMYCESSLLIDTAENFIPSSSTAVDPRPRPA